MNPERKLAAILNADVVGYSRLMSQDEAETVRTLEAYRDEMALLIQQHRGRVVDTAGDNLLAEFPTATDAVNCAVEIQGVLKVRNAPLADDRKMEFRIGVHLGEVRVEGDRLYGDGVNIAARLEGLAEPGGICISSVVYEQVEGKLALAFEDLGEQQVKNIARPVRVYRMREAGGVAATQPSRRGLLIAAAVVVVVGLGGLLAWWTQQDAAPSLALDDSLLALPTGPRVAVLPFTNLSGDPEQEYFSDGLTDNILTALSRFKDLFVIARNSTFRYKGKAVDVRVLREELGARYVLEGSVQRAGDRLRVTAQLLDAKDGTHLWAETLDRDLSAADIFAVQDEITDEVVATIGSDYGVISRARFSEIRAKPTDDLDAFECVLRVGAYYRDNYVPAKHLKVRDCLERAVESDSSYAEAWAQLSALYLDEYRFNYNIRANPLDRALEAAQAAIELDPANQTAHSNLAQTHFYKHELDAFLAGTERTIGLNPNNAPELVLFGEKLMCLGDSRGIALVRKAEALDPLHPTWFNFPIALYHFERSEYEQALAAARKVRVPGLWWQQVYLAAIYAQLDRPEEARAAVEELLRLYPGFTTESAIEEWRKWNLSDDSIAHWVAALRKAGVPEGAAGVE